MRDTLLQSLKKAARADKVSLVFKDGSMIEGAILFNEIKKCGKIINIDDEISLDFDIKEVQKVKL
jgi:hypothetical protein